jgi:hypothetical protein
MPLAALLCYVGFTALSLSMSRHYADTVGGRLTLERRKWLRVVGWITLVLSLWAGIGAGGWGLGLVQWFAALMGSAFVLLIAMSWRPRLALLLAGLSVAICAVAAVTHGFV